MKDEAREYMRRHGIEHLRAVIRAKDDRIDALEAENERLRQALREVAYSSPGIAAAIRTATEALEDK